MYALIFWAHMMAARGHVSIASGPLLTATGRPAGVFRWCAVTGQMTEYFAPAKEDCEDRPMYRGLKAFNPDLKPYGYQRWCKDEDGHRILALTWEVEP